MRTGRRLIVVVASLSLAVPIAITALGPISADAAAIQVQLGTLLFGDGRYWEALDAFRKAAPVEDTRLASRARAGMVRSGLRIAEFRLAAESAVILKRLEPQNAEVLGLYGDSRWAIGLFDDAEQAYRDVLGISPNDGRGHNGLARSLMSRGRLDEALAEAQAAVAALPSDPEVHHTLGSIYERMRQYDAAATALANCINLLPNKDQSEQAAWARSEVRFLRSFGERPPYDMAPGDRERRHTIPFTLRGEKVVVKAKINGSHDGVDFVLDTGAESTVISRRIAQRYGIEGAVNTLTAGVGNIGMRGLQVGRLDSFEIGSFKVKNVPVLIKNPPLEGLPTREPEGFSPLAMGLSLSVDYQRRLLTVGPGPADTAADFELPLRMHRLATVRGLVDQAHPANFVVDTGGEVISISSAMAGTLTKLRDSRRIRLKVYGTSGWDRDAYLLPGVTLAFDEIEFRDMPVVVLNLGAPSALLGYQLGGIVGHHFLSRYRFAIDLERSVLRLTSVGPARGSGN